MMKIFKSIAFLMLVSFALQGLEASDFLEKWGLRLNAGGVFPMFGQFNDHEKLKDVVNTGLSLGLSLRYEVNDNVYLDLGYSHSWMKVNSDHIPFAYKEDSPSFIMPMISLNGTFFLKSGYSYEPYITLGGQICSWKFTQIGISGDSWPAPGNLEESFADTSLGFNAGFGIESIVTQHLSVFAEARYYYLFSNDNVKLGTDDFTQQDFLGVNLGVVYYFGYK